MLYVMLSNLEVRVSNFFSQKGLMQSPCYQNCMLESFNCVFFRDVDGSTFNGVKCTGIDEQTDEIDLLRKSGLTSSKGLCISKWSLVRRMGSGAFGEPVSTISSPPVLGQTFKTYFLLFI